MSNATYELHLDCHPSHSTTVQSVTHVKCHIRTIFKLSHKLQLLKLTHVNCHIQTIFRLPHISNAIHTRTTFRLSRKSQVTCDAFAVLNGSQKRKVVY